MSCDCVIRACHETVYLHLSYMRNAQLASRICVFVLYFLFILPRFAYALPLCLLYAHCTLLLDRRYSLQEGPDHSLRVLRLQHFKQSSAGGVVVLDAPQKEGVGASSLPVSFYLEIGCY